MGQRMIFKNHSLTHECKYLYGRIKKPRKCCTRRSQSTFDTESKSEQTGIYTTRNITKRLGKRLTLSFASEMITKLDMRKQTQKNKAPDKMEQT